MEKFTDQIALLIGLVFYLNGYSCYDEMCLAVKDATNGTLQCSDDKSININQIGFANNSCSSDAFLYPQKLSLLKSITCYNRSTCIVPFSHPRYNYLHIGFQCIDEMCHGVKDDTNGTLQCPDNKSINIKQIGFANSSCPSDAFLFPQNISRLKSFTCNKSTCTVPFSHTRYNFLNIGFKCQADNDTDRRFNESGHDHDNSKYPSNHDNRNHTSDNGGNLTHTSDHDSSDRTHTTDHDSSDRTLTSDHYNGNRNHTTDNYYDNRTPTPDHDNGNRTHTTEHDKVFQTMTNPCFVCSTNEKCLTVQKDTVNNITCNNDQRINITTAWVDKYDCNDIRFIARNVIYRTHFVSDLCSGHFKCSIPYHSSVVGVLNILYFCNDRRLSSNHMNKHDKSSNEQKIGDIAGSVTGILIALLMVGVFMFRRCRNKSNQESNPRSDRKTMKTRSNPMYDPNELQEDQEVNNKTPFSTKAPQKTPVYSMDTNYDYIQSKESKDNNFENGRDTSYTYKRDSSAYDHIKNKDVMRNQQIKMLETDVYSHLNGCVASAVSDAIYDHTLHDGIRNNCEGDYDISHGIMTDDDYDVSGNFNLSQVKKLDYMYS